jgi:hypothetical protein
MANSLPTLLKEFAIELPLPKGPKAGIQRDAATLVRRFRKHIANCFHDLHRPGSLNDEEGTTPEASATLQEISAREEVRTSNFDASSSPDLSTSQEVSAEEKVRTWTFEGPSSPDLPVEVPLDAFSSDGFKEDDIDDGLDDMAVPEFYQAREFLVEGHAFKRLMERIRVASLVTERKDSISQSIRTQIIEATSTRESLRRQTHDRDPGTNIFEATFRVLWSPVAFLETQFVENTAIMDVITLTGTADHAQALSCASYMRQTWPWSGEACVKILQAAIDHGSHKGR